MITWKKGMRLAMNKKMKYILATASLFFVVGFGIFWNNIAQVWGYIDPGILPTVLKEHVASTDIDAAPVVAAEKANVLFLIDVGSAMIFTPKGQLPDWRAEYVKYAPRPNGAFNLSVWSNTNAQNQANATTSAQMAQCTFGSGGLPAASLPQVPTNSIRAGRDLDTTNNTQGNPDNYYNTSVLGFPPNDSRLYKMKLVLWRMLDEASLFENLRFGLATTYQEEMTASTGLTADFYKVSPFGAATGFPNGVGPDWATGPGKNSTINAQPIQWGVDVTAYNDPNTVYPTSKIWFAINRAYLRIPFGDNTTEHVRKFRTLINGVENNNTVPTSAISPDFRIIDPEIVGDGRTPLANSIFPATKQNGTIVNIRDTMINGTGPSGNVKRIYYSRRTADIKRMQSYGFHWFGKASGEAAGTVLDFFSPPVAGKGSTYTAEDALNAQRGNFPIRNRCESNWLIVFTAGDDSSAYSSAEAVRDLYNHTASKDVVMLKGTGDPSSSNLEAVQLFQPIRTMVIGFVDPTDNATLDLRNKLNLMADYGDDGIANGSAEAYFANDVPGLIEAMRSALSRVNAKVVKQASGTALPVDPRVAEDAPENELFSASYKRIDEAQWTGFFERFKASPDWTIITPRTWELGGSLDQYATSDPGKRRLLIPNFASVPSGPTGLIPFDSHSNLALVPFPTDTESTPSSLASIMGLTTGQLKNYTTGPHPSNLMLRWLHGSDYSYVTKKSEPRTSMLSDIGKSNFVIVGRVLSGAVTNQPGYSDFANAQANRLRTIYVQSNGGMLHALDGSLTPPPGTLWGRERWAFIPPNVLANQRLAGLKFVLSTGITNKQTADWINAPQSKAAFLTDGGIVTQNLPNGTTWGTYLIGTLGRGGNGVYAMDITNPQKPNFLWAVDNNAYSFNTKNSGSVHFWSAAPASQTQYSNTTYNNLTAGSFNPPTKDYRRLGWNAPIPAIGATTPSQNIGVLAAGMQYALDLTKNGTIGSAIYIFNPITGLVIREFSPSNPSSLEWTSGSATGENPSMGMMVTPPSLAADSVSGYATAFFTADNRGNIFEGLFGSTIKRVASLKLDSENTATDNFAIPHKLLLLKKKSINNLFAFGGTADIAGRIYGEDLGNKNSVSSIINKTQHLFGFRDDWSAADRTLFLRSTTKTKPLNRNLAAASFDITSSPNQRGWIIDLKPADSDFMREYASTGFVEYRKRKTSLIYASTFLCNLKTELTPEDLLKCLTPNVKGKSNIYQLDAFTGAGGWEDGKTKYIEIDGIKIAGLAVVRFGKNARLFFSMAILDDKKFEQSMANPTDGAGNRIDAEAVDIRKHSDTLGSIALRPDDDPAVKGERLNYWREVYTR